MHDVLLLGHKGGIGSAVRELLEKQGMRVRIFPKFRYPLTSLPHVDPDVVINCVGAIEVSDLSPESAWKHLETLRTNLELPTQLMARYPDATHINIGSSAAENPRGGWSGYCASKAALQTLTRCVSEEGMQAFCISPGRTHTNMRTSIAGKENLDTLLLPEQVAKYVLRALEGDYPNGSIIEVRKIENGEQIRVEPNYSIYTRKSIHTPK